MSVGGRVGLAVAQEAGRVINLGQLPAPLLLPLSGLQVLQHLLQDTLHLASWAAMIIV